MAESVETSVLTKGDLTEGLERLASQRRDYERLVTEQITILQTKELVQREKIEKIDSVLGTLPLIEVKLQRILEVIDGSARHSDIGALRRIDALEKNRDGRTFIVALASAVMTAIGALLLVLFAKT